MLYFHKAGLVLLSTPKTASTALEDALAPHADIVLTGDAQIKHCNFARYRLRILPLIRDLTPRPPETAALIRHPEDWLGSWYRYRHGSWLDGTARSTRGMRFDQFVDAYLQDTPPPFAHVGAQASFLTDPRSGDTVQTLFRYNALDGWRDWLQERLSVTITLQHLNPSPEADLDLPAPLRARLRDKHARDYELFDRARTA